ncbi:unnamed protein product [Linum trigynum]|uniref:Uncharacterized protein n=1 Tax=Linum trigynum TaxID=586398 RepID=A0AAV2DGS5_9ROSI
MAIRFLSTSIRSVMAFDGGTESTTGGGCGGELDSSSSGSKELKPCLGKSSSRNGGKDWLKWGEGILSGTFKNWDRGRVLGNFW